LLKEAVDWAQGENLLSEITAQVLISIIERVTWHSFRVTLLNLALHKGKHSEAIALQANWSEPGPLVQKYARNRREVPLKMVNELVKELRSEWVPSGDPVDFEDEELLPPEDPIMFFAKFPAVCRATFKIEALKFHVSSVLDESSTACGRRKPSECEAMGSALPRESALCGACARSRPECKPKI